MSLTVLLLAAAHGIPVLLASLSGKRSVVTVVALVMAAIGIAVGNPVYMFVDVLAVFVVWLLVTRALSRQ